MPEKIVVTSLGIISALGNGAKQNKAALFNAEHGLTHPRHLQTVHAAEFLLGEVNLSNDELSELLGLPTGDNGYTRTTLLALVAMKETVSNIDIELLRSEPLALINANTVGGMCSVEDMYMDFISEKTDGPFIKYIDTLDCAESTLNIAQFFDIHPLSATLSTACSSSANAILLGARMIKHGLVKRAICGGCDGLSRYTVNGFNSLKNMSRQACQPFDENRTGLNLGEGAGYLILESETSAKERGATILATLSGYGNMNDAHHPTAPSPNGDGAYNTMQLALENAQLQIEDIDYINAHGTATLNNDQSEGKAIERLFGDKTPHFSSTKPFTGHTLAAAGAIEAIFSIWAMQENTVLPNLNLQTPMEEINIRPTTSYHKTEIKHILSNSFGFGGNNVSLLFSK
ncbi:MAG: beta-ketoacyl-[acyl-carrier-protein] synthase family protein [Flavipsychrobacter sp.]